MLSLPIRAVIALSFLFLPLIRAQFVSSLPQCVQNCIEQSPDDNCEITDMKCLCRASAGNFLPDLIICTHGGCDNDLDNNLLLTSLQLACVIAGTPIPDSAIRNAENEASSLATQVMTTVTMSGSSATGGAGATITVDLGSTVTVTTTQSGTTIYEIYPITVGSTTTITGPTSTRTISKTYDPGTYATYTTTNSRGQTVTLRPSLISANSLTSQGSSSSSTASGNSDTTTTTSVAAQETSSSESSSKTSKTTKAPNPDATDSAPFKDTNSSGVRVRNGTSLYMWICVMTSVLWIGI
ncbi:hypothetical protein BDZ45DRAFT_682732 [Acephala macrosclerotiorum]|nr:hypothetical protein BDZ45DRAFT_682732 [Acephala macrosclerotiorum]